MEVNPPELTGQLKKRKDSFSTFIMVLSMLLSLLLVSILAFFFLTQFKPKQGNTLTLDTFSPSLNIYPGAILVASDSESNLSFRHNWHVYATKDELTKVIPYYQDQFQSQGYKPDPSASAAYPLEYYREQQTSCSLLRNGLDVSALEQSKLELPGIDYESIKIRFKGQTVFVIHQLDTIIQEPNC